MILEFESGYGDVGIAVEAGIMGTDDVGMEVAFVLHAAERLPGG